MPLLQCGKDNGSGSNLPPAYIKDQFVPLLRNGRIIANVLTF